MSKRTGGYISIVDPVEGNREYETFTCFHCQHLIHFATRAQLSERSGGCSMCSRVICLPCVEKGSCTPWEKQIEHMENRERFRRQAGLLE